MAAAVFVAGPAAAIPVLPLDIELRFDREANGALTGSFVGFGQLHLDVDPDDGGHLLGDFFGLTFLGAFPDLGFVFTLEDLLDDLDQVLLRLDSPPRDGRSVGLAVLGGLGGAFGDAVAFEATYGQRLLFEPEFGSEDTFLIEPPHMGGEIPPAPQSFPGGSGVEGQVSAGPVPPPAAAMAPGLLGLATLRRRRA